jgi:hypothetical protein
MQEFYRGGEERSGRFDRGGFAPLMRSSGRDDELIRRQLGDARSLARRGEFRMAREQCADIVLEHQLRLHDDPGLRRCAIATLVHARAFQLLSRLLAAVDGRRVRISLAPAALGAAQPPHPIRRSETGGTAVFEVDESLLRSPSCDGAIDRWSEELARTRGNTLEAMAA